VQGLGLGSARVTVWVCKCKDVERLGFRRLGCGRVRVWKG
jgi:hypothetical protein